MGPVGLTKLHKVYMHHIRFCSKAKVTNSKSLAFFILPMVKFLNASKYCGSVLKNDFVVVVLVVVVGVLTNFYHIFKESDYFESHVETCPKRKIVVRAA